MAVAPDMIVDVAGSGRDRGRAHGEVLRGRIADALERWDAEVGERMGIPAADHVAGLLAATRFVPAIEASTPQLLEEVRGIADGAAVSFELDYLLTGRAEICVGRSRHWVVGWLWFLS